MNASNRHYSKGIIERIDYDHDHDVMYVTGHFEHVGCTGFGGIVLDEHLHEAFEKEIMTLFGVTSMDECVGKECWGLWCRGQNNETMAGIETERGRLTLAGFTKKYCPPEKHRDEFTNARVSIIAEIAWAKGRLFQAEEDLKRLDADLANGKFIDWESAPVSVFVKDTEKP